MMTTKIKDNKELINVLTRIAEALEELDETLWEKLR